MFKPVDFICPNCDRIKEELVHDNSEHNDAPWCYCTTPEDGQHIISSIGKIKMIPIFSPKKNGQRWRFRD